MNIAEDQNHRGLPDSACRGAERIREANPVAHGASASWQVEVECHLELESPLLASRTRGRTRIGEAEFPVPQAPSAMPAGCAQLIQSLKTRIWRARIRAANAANHEL